MTLPSIPTVRPHLDPDFLSDELFDALVKQLTPLPPKVPIYTAISNLTPRDALNHYLTDNGIFNFTDKILAAIESINSATKIQ